MSIEIRNLTSLMDIKIASAAQQTI